MRPTKRDQADLRAFCREICYTPRNGGHSRERGIAMGLIDHVTQPWKDWRPGVSTRMRISALTGASSLSIFEQWVDPGLGAPIHWHPVKAVLTVQAGAAEIWIEGQSFHASAGQSALISAKRRHSFRNVGSDKLHMLAILASPVFEAHFDDSAAPVHRWGPDPGEGRGPR
ncbi:cupin domain-containing protein [Thioclava sp. FR2]|uniref:cupin domain-containing protein n=1 Tax=Thioclava sp. FR2 TaxID=3445780 RepID=UPI003EC0518D